MLRRIRFLSVCVLMVMCLAMISGCSSDTIDAEEQSPSGETEFVDLKDFTAATADDQKITQSYFADYDATIINIWATFCPPCIEEMPKIAELEQVRPDIIGMLLICLDAFNEPDYMQELLDEAGYKGINLIRGNGDYAALSSSVQVVPTTIFVDSEGNLVGEPVIGASMNPKMTYYKHINVYLKQAGLETIDW